MRERERETDSVSLPTLNILLESDRCFELDCRENVHLIWILFSQFWVFIKPELELELEMF